MVIIFSLAFAADFDNVDIAPQVVLEEQPIQLQNQIFEQIHPKIVSGLLSAHKRTMCKITKH